MIFPVFKKETFENGSRERVWRFDNLNNAVVVESDISSEVGENVTFFYLDANHEHWVDVDDEYKRKQFSLDDSLFEVI